MKLGGRMRGYENVHSHVLTRRVPVIIRVDGRSFHSLSLFKPFDSRFVSVMCEAAQALADEMQGFQWGYVQSDEASFLLTDWENLDTEPWFGYKVNKLVSISAARMSVAFNRWWENLIRTNEPPGAVFDSRAFNIPEVEVANYFFWRLCDCQRNALTTYARSIFSHKELQGKNRADKLAMLEAKGYLYDWVCSQFRNGVFFKPGEEGFVCMSPDGLPDDLLECFN